MKEPKFEKVVEGGLHPMVFILLLFMDISFLGLNIWPQARSAWIFFYSIGNIFFIMHHYIIDRKVYWRPIK